MPGPGAPRPGLLRHRGFLLLWGGQTVSETGSQVTALPLVAIVTLRASALQVGLLSTAVTGGYLLMSFPAGLLADRVAKRRLMLWCDLALLLVVGSVPAAQAAGLLTLAQLYGVAAAASVPGVVSLVASTRRGSRGRPRPGSRPGPAGRSPAGCRPGRSAGGSARRGSAGCR